MINVHCKEIICRAILNSMRLANEAVEISIIGINQEQRIALKALGRSDSQQRLQFSNLDFYSQVSGRKNRNQ